MPRRMIASDIWRNEKFGCLSINAKLLFIGIFSNADDDGRLKAKPKYLKACIFPYEEITVKEIESLRQECIDNNLVKLYSNGVGEYLYCFGWYEHQSIRKELYKASRLPEPPLVDGDFSRKKEGEKEESKTSATRQRHTCDTQASRQRHTSVSQVIHSIDKSSIDKYSIKGSKEQKRIKELLKKLINIEKKDIDEINIAIESAGDLVVIEALKMSAGKMWAYTRKILQNWAKNGIPQNTLRIIKDKDPDKYIKGKYGHMVKR